MFTGNEISKMYSGVIKVLLVVAVLIALVSFGIGYGLSHYVLW